MPLPVLPVKHVIFSSCDLYRHLLQIFYQIHIIDHNLNRFEGVRRGSWVCFIFLVNFVVVTNQSNLQFDWFCLLVLCELIILKTSDVFSLEYSSNFAKLPHNFFVCSYCGKFVCSPPILTELLQRQRQSLSELNPPFILFYFPTSLNPFSLLYLSMSLHLYFSDFEQIY